MSQYRIGDFSRITGLTVKALRHYQEEGLLLPAWVDEESGYRYYDEPAMERAHLIRQLRDLGLSLPEIGSLLAGSRGDEDVREALERRLTELRTRIANDRALERRLKALLQTPAMRNGRPEESVPPPCVIDTVLPDILALTFRFRGPYSHSGSVIGRLARAAGRRAAGPPFSLYYDAEYQEDADIEVCLPLHGPVHSKDLVTRSVPGGHALSWMHIGPYETIGRGYQRLLEAAAERNLKWILPLREVYVRGPGPLIRGDPSKYRTELFAFYRPA